MKTVTIKQIAEETGFSRNTVSKALNNKYVPQKTLDAIVSKAIELGYKGFSTKNIMIQKRVPKYNFLILLKSSLVSMNFFSAILKGIKQSKHTTNEDINTIPYISDGINSQHIQIFKSLINDKEIDGIICFELFDDHEIDMVLSSELPTVFIDSKVFMDSYDGNYDILLMKSYDNIYQLITQLATSGATSLGFIGDIYHCRGFHERYLGSLAAATALNFNDFIDYSIIDREDSSSYKSYLWFRKKLQSLSIYPDIFICANDTIAMYVLQVLKDLDLRIPKDIQIIGFDNIIESEFSKPKLTTIHTPKEIIGQEAVDLLINRINYKQMSPRTIYINTQIIQRNSTLHIV